MGDRFVYWPLPKDFHCKADYGVATLTEGEHVICADDDVLPLGGFTETLHKWAMKLDPAWVGLNGRKCTGPVYRKCHHANSRSATAAVEVDVVGVVYMAHRRFFTFDVKGLVPVMDDFHHMLAFQSTKKYVVPNPHFRDLTICNGPSAMWSSPVFRNQRQELYAKVYERHFHAIS